MSYNSSGEKLMQLRKKYGIKQYELAGENISRSYIGMVEQNRRKITRNKAEEIARNFNKLLNKKDITIKLEDFFVEIEEEMSGKADKIIKVIKEKKYSEDFFDELKNMENEIIENTIQNKALIYVELGEKFFITKEFVLSVFYFEKALEFFIASKQIKEIVNIGERVSSNYIELERYTELKLLYYRINLFLSKVKFNVKNLILFNFAKGFYKLKEYKESLKLLNSIKLSAKDRDIKYEIFVLAAKNYKRLDRLNEAEFYYEKIMENTKDLDYIRASLETLKLKKNKNITKREMKEVYVKLKKLINEVEHEKIIGEDFYNIAEISLVLGEKTEALDYLKKALEKTENLENLEKIIEVLFIIHNEMENKSIKYIESRFLEIVTKKDSAKLLLLFSKFYLKNDMLKENREFIDKVATNLG